MWTKSVCLHNLINVLIKKMKPTLKDQLLTHTQIHTHRHTHTHAHMRYIIKTLLH